MILRLSYLELELDFLVFDESRNSCFLRVHDQNFDFIHLQFGLDLFAEQTEFVSSVAVVGGECGFLGRLRIDGRVADDRTFLVLPVDGVPSTAF